MCPYDLARFGGVQGQVLSLAGWLRDAGHEALVVGPGAHGEGSVSVGGVTVITANGSSTPISLDPRAVRRVLAAVATADVVHIHEPMMPLVSLVATVRVAAPSVGTFHADAGRLVRFGYRRGFGFGAGSVGKLDVITAVSPIAASPLKEVVQHRIIPNGLDVDVFTGFEKVLGRIAFVGRDDPRKARDVFIAAATRIAVDHPQASFVAAGSDEVATVGPVRFVGRPSDEEKIRMLGAADIFVAPHRGGESFGMVVVEAMAAGCAVVASALPAFAHVLGDAGLLVPPGDSEAVVRAVSWLLDEPERMRELQKAAQERVRMFDRSVVLDGYLGAYSDALQR